MKVTRSEARGLVAVGLLGSLVWSVVVEMAMPSWFDPGDSCPGVTTVERTYFPPTARCIDEAGRAVDYIPSSKTVILTVVMVLLAITTVTGLVLLGWRLLRRDQAAAQVPNSKRPVFHVLGAAILGVVVCVVARAAVVITALLGGPPGGATALLIVALGAIGSVSALDRAAGPGRGGSAGSYRRGTVLVLAGIAVTLALVFVTWREYIEDNTLLGPGWAVAMGGGVFAALAGLQWVRWPGARRSGPAT